MKKVEQFFQSVHHPFVVVSSYPFQYREDIIAFLLRLNAPVYLEGISGLREEPRLQHLRVSYVQKIWTLSIDGVFRIGGVPTPRFWRDLEEKKGEIQLLSFSHLPWRGVSWGDIVNEAYTKLGSIEFSYETLWYQEPSYFREALDHLLETFPNSEPGIMRKLSKAIPNRSLVYVGNSLPIREWDLAAVNDHKQLDLYASRGMNGIDGQLSTFLGMAQPNRSNWCILGDLTTLYDLAGPWILDQLEATIITICVINNGGGMIFSRMSDRTCLQNRHSINFQHFAKMWNLDYCTHDGLSASYEGRRLIELVPCPAETEAFWKKYQTFKSSPHQSQKSHVSNIFMQQTMSS